MAVKTFTTNEVLTASDTNTYLANSGLVYVTSATATSGSYLDILSCFSATYTNYLVLIDNAVASATLGVQIALTTGSTPTLNAANWVWGQARPDYAASTFSYTKEINSSYGNQVCVATTSTPSSGKCELFRPNKTTYTDALSHGQDGRGSTGYMPLLTSGTLQNSTAYTGLRVLFSGGTITSLSVTVFGYRTA